MKYAFILTFDVRYDNGLHTTSEMTVQRDDEELCYSEVTEARQYLKSRNEAKTGVKVTGIVLLNCTRTLNDSDDK